ncbi:MAG: hypothetical protein A2Z18_02120 [Armatimonadetes bacterium RBG_16_58_9]|nr:MAG: hypothetical protein A2Z18_02120 [Armatimonadetes bacterium RBG_16_58_9]
MNGRCCLHWAVCAVLCLAALTEVQAAQVVKGTLVASPAEAGFIRVEIDGKITAIKPSSDAKIMRGQVGKDIVDVNLREFAPGDHIVAIVKEDGFASSVKAFHGRVQGMLARVDGRKMTLADERTVMLAAQPQIVLPDGRTGTPADLKPGALLICRVNPITGQAWTVVATGNTKSEKSAATSQPEPDSKPKIRSVMYSAPDPLKAGDLLTVDLTGNPGGKASFEVKRLLPVTPMKEVSPGSYRAVVEVPRGKTVVGAPLIGRLAVKDEQAPPVQASRLITVIGGRAEDGQGTSLPPAKPAPKAASTPRPKPVSTPAAAQTASRLKASAPSTSETQIESDASTILLQPPVATEPEDETGPDVEVASISETLPVTIGAPTVVVPIEDADHPAPPAPRCEVKVMLTNPPEGATISRAILVRGAADPDSKVRVEITYNNGKTGILKLAGLAASQDLAVGSDGKFRMGPLPLEGPLATRGLVFTIKAYYPEREDHGTDMVKVVGGRD